MWPPTWEECGASVAAGGGEGGGREGEGEENGGGRRGGRQLKTDCLSQNTLGPPKITTLKMRSET